jgi:hypothetical protein
MVTWIDNSSDELGFRVERSSSPSGPWASIGSLGANTTSLTEYYPPPEQRRCYRVFGYNYYGDSDPSNVVCTAMPAAPSGVAASLVNSSVDLTWTDNSAFEDGFVVSRYSGVAGWSDIATLPANARSYHDANLSDGVYSYQVRAMRDGGSSANSNVAEVVVASAPPIAPTPVDAIPSSSNSVSIYWPSYGGEAGFRVERSTDGGANWSALATLGRQNGFEDYPVQSEHAVCYRVVAFNNLGESPASDSDCTTPPAGPTEFNARGIDDVTIELSWTDNSAVEDGYEVWVDDGYGDQWLIASVGPNVTSYQYTEYYAYYYYYFVVALKDGGYSDFSYWAYPSAPAGGARVGSRQPGRAPQAPRPALHKH